MSTIIKTLVAAVITTAALTSVTIPADARGFGRGGFGSAPMHYGYNRFGHGWNRYGYGWNRFGYGWNRFGYGWNRFGYRPNRFIYFWPRYNSGWNRFGNNWNRFGTGWHRPAPVGGTYCQVIVQTPMGPRRVCPQTAS